MCCQEYLMTISFRYGFYYDSSMPTESPSWPYSLEYRMPHSCSVKPCPSESHPGMWEVPMKTLKDVRFVSLSRLAEAD